MTDKLAIDRIAKRLEEKAGALDTQMLCLAEEVGEAIQEYRRMTGRARQRGSITAFAEELADVVIVTELTAVLAGIDLDAAVAAKLQQIEERGGI